MKKVLFNEPLNIKESIFSIKKFIQSGQSLHGPGKYSHKIKTKLRIKYGFADTYLTNSCTAAMEIAALSMNLKKNDEVILPSYTFVTTGSSFARTGCKIVYCDIDEENLMPSFDQIKKLVTKKTRAIVIVHYQGFSVDYLDKLQEFCRKKNIFLVEDAAQAMGSYFKDKPLGSYGDFGCISFHHTKNIHSGIGGLLILNNKKLKKKIDFIYDKGTDRSLVISKKRKYYSWTEIGSCFLLSELHASYLFPQIKKIDKINNYRRILYNRYLSNFNKWKFKNFKIINKFKYKYNYHALVILLKTNKRVDFLNFLKKFNIFPFIGYVPLHSSPIGKKYLTNSMDLTFTKKLEKKIVRLPLHANLLKKDIDYITSKIQNFFNKK